METNKIAVIESVANSAAFPMNFEYSGETKDGVPSINTKVAFGLTKREYISGVVLAGLSQSYNEKYFVNNGVLHYETIVKDAIGLTDELIKQLYQQD